MLKKADIIGHLMSTCCDSCEYIQYTGVYLTGISLSGYRIALLESHLGCDHRIDLVDGLLISVEQFQERSLGSGGSLRA